MVLVFVQSHLFVKDAFGSTFNLIKMRAWAMSTAIVDLTGIDASFLAGWLDYGRPICRSPWYVIVSVCAVELNVAVRRT